MTDFNFSIPIQVRYGDLDPQWHVNNARFLTYLEQSRFAYITELGLWNGKSFLDLGLIVANMNIAFLAPIEYNMDVRVYARISRLGNKSMIFEHEIRGYPQWNHSRPCRNGDGVLRLSYPVQPADPGCLAGENFHL